MKDDSSARARQLISKNVSVISHIQKEADTQRTTGERLADSFARFVGSWYFLIGQSVVLAAWVILNACGLFKAWDPYPFILLNLMLSFQAAYASPIIMMSQNRQARVADQRNHLALQIALLAEQEDTETLRLIRQICEKLNIPTEESERALEEATDPASLHREIRDAEKQR